MSSPRPVAGDFCIDWPSGSDVATLNSCWTTFDPEDGSVLPSAMALTSGRGVEDAAGEAWADGRSSSSK